MKRLILVRHAKTEPLTEASSDFERKLKPRGNKDAVLVANYLCKKNIRPDLIISSPAVRAIETARLFARLYDMKFEKVIEESYVYDGFTIQTLVDEVSRVAGDLNSVMVIGHNPDIAMAAIQLSTGDFFHFPTAAAAVLSFSVNQWEDIKKGKGRSELFICPKDLK